MGKWSGGVGCFGNLIDFETCDVGHGIVESAMPGLTSNLSTRYNKLDDSVFLLCQNCGHSFKTDELKKMANYRGPTPTTRFRATSKHFLTWSATAANHKLQKLSKNLVNNVSKLQSKFPFHHQNHSQQSQSTSSDNEDTSDWEPPCMNNGLGRNNNSSNNGNSSSSADLMANDSLILNNNNNNMTTTTLLSNSTAITVNVNSSSAAVVKSRIRDPWNNRSTSNSNSGQNLNEKSALLVKNLVGVQVTNTFELRPVVTVDEGHQNQSYNNGSGSTVSMAGTTLPITSPHWSPASSISSSTIGFLNSQSHAAVGNPNSNNINRLGHPHAKEAIRLPLFSSRSSTGSNNSGRSPSPVDEDNDDHGLLVQSSTSTPLNNKLTVTIFEEEAEQLKQAPWFQAGIPREIALEVLRNEPIGSFIVRESTTKSGCFALSMRVPREFQPMGISHYLILRTGRGYKIKGFTKEFQSLVSLITHHSVMAELLPCPLSLHRHHRSKYSRRRTNSSDFVEPEKLIPLRKFTDF